MRACDCGAGKCKTTHAAWCSSIDVTATVAIVPVETAGFTGASDEFTRMIEAQQQALLASMGVHADLLSGNAKPATATAQVTRAAQRRSEMLARYDPRGTDSSYLARRARRVFQALHGAGLLGRPLNLETFAEAIVIALDAL
jgi:hypothetical protein